jgi:NADPH:quinone reductase-like Zn-dependent oxidoreductase
VNLVLDMVGGEYAARNIECLGRFGRLVQIAAQSGADASVNLLKIMQKRLTITGSTLRPRSKEEKAQIASDLLRHVWPLVRERKVRAVVDRVFPFQEVIAAHRYLEAGGHTGKVILEMPA